MKKLKYLFWLIFIAFFALLVYQNLDFFSAKYSLHIDLGIYQKATPEWTNGAIIGGFVGIGVFIMLIMYFISQFGVYRARKTIRELKTALDDRSSVLTSLKNELATLKSGGYAAQEHSAESGISTEPTASEETKSA